MLRGHRTYLNLFDDDTPEPPAKAARRGRSEMLHAKRNELLIHRYYYHIKIKNSQYLNTLSTLEDELFISQRTIVDTVALNVAILKELNVGKPDAGYFKKKYPHLVW